MGTGAVAAQLPAPSAVEVRDQHQQPVLGRMDVGCEDHDLLFELFECVDVGERVECGGRRRRGGLLRVDLCRLAYAQQAKCGPSVKTVRGVNESDSRHRSDLRVGVSCDTEHTPHIASDSQRLRMLQEVRIGANRLQNIRSKANSPQGSERRDQESESAPVPDPRQTAISKSVKKLSVTAGSCVRAAHSRHTAAPADGVATNSR